MEELETAGGVVFLADDCCVPNQLLAFDPLQLSGSIIRLVIHYSHGLDIQEEGGEVFIALEGELEPELGGNVVGEEDAVSGAAEGKCRYPDGGYVRVALVFEDHEPDMAVELVMVNLDGDVGVEISGGVSWGRGSWGRRGTFRKA